jgi:hypothetical protein
MYLQKSNDSKIADNSDISATLTFSKTWESHNIWGYQGRPLNYNFLTFNKLELLGFGDPFTTL